MRQNIIVPVWGTLTDQVIGMIIQDLIIAPFMENPVMSFHQGADPVDLSRIMSKVHHAGVHTLYPLPQGTLPSEVWLYTSPKNQAMCPPEYRCCRVRVRMLEQPAPRPLNTRRPALPKHGHEPIVHNDPMPPLRVNIPHSNAPAWMYFSQNELRRLNGKG